MIAYCIEVIDDLRFFVIGSQLLTIACHVKIVNGEVDKLRYLPCRRLSLSKSNLMGKSFEVNNQKFWYLVDLYLLQCGHMILTI